MERTAQEQASDMNEDQQMSAAFPASELAGQDSATDASKGML